MHLNNPRPHSKSRLHPKSRSHRNLRLDLENRKYRYIHGTGYEIHRVKQWLYSEWITYTTLSVYSSESFQMFSNDTNYRSVIIFFCLKIIALQIIQRLHWFIRQTTKSPPKSQFKLSNRSFWATATEAYWMAIWNIYGE